MAGIHLGGSVLMSVPRYRIILLFGPFGGQLGCILVLIANIWGVRLGSLLVPIDNKGSLYWSPDT